MPQLFIGQTSGTFTPENVRESIPPGILQSGVATIHCKLLQLKPSMSFGQALGKLQRKVVTHSEEVGWWRTWMGEYVTLFFYYLVHMGRQIDQSSWIYYGYKLLS